VKLTFVLLLAAGLGLGTSSKAHAQAGAATPENRVVVDNDRVVIRDVSAPARQTISVSPSNDAVVVYLADGKVGTAVYEKKGASVTASRAIVIELKGRHAPYPNTTGYPNAFPRPGNKKLLDNDRVVVWDYTWNPGVATPMHFHDKDVVVVYLADGALTSTAPDGAKTVNDYSFGFAKFNPGNRSHTELLSRGNERAIIVELK
jgi:hypothetical protein